MDFKKIASWLLIAGGLNWGLTIFNMNLVSQLAGSFSNWVYGAVGLAAVYTLYEMYK